jgi:NADPH:quinone reductase-like Zn-dependent oxidoreductase
MDLLVSGELAPVLDVVWPLAQASAAHDRLEAGRQFGKIVLRP